MKLVQSTATSASARAEVAERQLAEARDAAESARREGRLSQVTPSLIAPAAHVKSHYLSIHSVLAC